jgi:microcystin-dependent protein
MASTFSPSLRIELIGDGDQSGIWGQTTNNNLGALIEQAIAGVITIDMVNSNYPLSNFNGVSDEARNQVIVLTGTNTAQRNLIAPLVEKTYTIKNTTGGGFGVKIVGPSGTGGVVIPNGVTTTVYCDGLDFYPSINGVAGNFVVSGDATITGNLTVNGSNNVVPAGSLLMWTTAVAPSGYLLCNGAAVSRSTYANLFAVIGTTFGPGDTTTTFTLPNYTLRFPMGATTASAFTGSISGNTLTVTSTTTNNITVGSVISGSGVAPTTTITANISGGFPGGVGTYTVSISQTVGSTAMTGTLVYGVGQQGGSTDATLASHTHTFSGNTGAMNSNQAHVHSASDSGHYHDLNTDPPNTGIFGQTTGASQGPTAGFTGGAGVAVHNPYTNFGFAQVSIGATNIDHLHPFSGTTASAGSSAINANLPPYLAINYIIKF